MLTDATPRKANRAAFLESDRIRTLDLPQDERLLAIATSLESAMKAGTTVDVRRACADFLNAASGFYKVPACGIRVLAARPLRVRESFFFSSRRRHTRFDCDWSSDVCSSD